MSDTADKIIALKCVIDRLQPDTAPTLSFGEVVLEVDRAQLAKTWTINTAYNIGDIIVPAVRNGHCYECTQPGTSQATALSYTDWLTYSGVTLGDGSSNPQLTWQEIGSDIFNPGIFGAERNVYDINRAAKRCCELKAAKAAALIDNGDASVSQVRKHWLEEAAKFVPFRRAITLIRC